MSRHLGLNDSRCRFLSLFLLDGCSVALFLFLLRSSVLCGLWLNRGSSPELGAGLIAVSVASLLNRCLHLNLGWNMVVRRTDGIGDSI